MSALDGRIRALAREEAQRLFLSPEQMEQAKASGVVVTGEQPDRVAELAKQVAELTARVEELEKATTPAAKRTARKTASETTA